VIILPAKLVDLSLNKPKRETNIQMA